MMLPDLDAFCTLSIAPVADVVSGHSAPSPRAAHSGRWARSGVAKMVRKPGRFSSSDQTGSRSGYDDVVEDGIGDHSLFHVIQVLI